MALRIPNQIGFMGAVALREAKAGEFHDVISIVQSALAKKLNPLEKHPWISLHSIYADHVVIRREGRFLSFAYTLNDSNEVTFEAPKEVVRTWQPTEVTNLTEAYDQPTPERLFESTSEKNTFLVTLIEAGQSLNGAIYPAKVLREAAPMFNNKPAMIKGDVEHLQGQGKHFNNLIGKFTESQWVAKGGSKGQGAIQAKLTVLKTSSVLEKLREAVDEDMTDLFGLSIDVDSFVKKHPNRLREATKFVKVNSVDLIISPGAGGRVMNLVEAEGANNMNPILQQLLEALSAKDPKLAASINTEDETQAVEQIVEAFAGLTDGGQPDNIIVGGAGVGATTEEVATMIEAAQAIVSAKADGKIAIAGSNLPELSKQRLTESLDTLAAITPEHVASMIEAEGKYVAGLTDDGKINMPEGGAQYSNYSNAQQMLEAYFKPDDDGVTSFKEAYVEITGDKNVTGLIHNCSRQRMLEALDSNSFGNVLADVVGRRMVHIYATLAKYQLWRKVFRVVNVTDFKEQKIVQWGGFGDLQSVAESGNYPFLSEPTDNTTKYSVGKYGGLASVTLELIKNDDQRVIPDIPNKLARAAARTLSKHAWDMYLSNALAPDGKALHHADHNNLFANAISQEELLLHYNAILNQEELDTGEILEIEPAFLLCSLGNQKDAHDLFKTENGSDKKFEQELNLDIIRVPGWTDPNDWGLVTDPAELAVAEMGFLDGMQEPELFTQDLQNTGTVFTNDTTTMKIRHIYGGCIVDERGSTMAKVP